MEVFGVDFTAVLIKPISSIVTSSLHICSTSGKSENDCFQEFSCFLVKYLPLSVCLRLVLKLFCHF